MKITRRSFSDAFSFEHSTIRSIVERSANLPGGKVKDTHVAPSRSLSDAAYWYVQCYKGSLDFMISLRQQFDKGYDLSAAQLAGALNCMLSEAKRSKPAPAISVNLKAIKPEPAYKLPEPVDVAPYVAQEPAPRQSGARAALARIEAAKAAFTQEVIADALEALGPDDGPQVAPVAVEPAQTATEPASIVPVIYDGTYTVVLSEAGDYRTIKVETIKEGSSFKAAPGSQIASYLMGSNNERDYKGFATITGGSSKVWAKAKGDSALAQALRILLEADKETLKDMGHAYALESGNCWRCGKKLTVPASINRGLGPICAEKL